MQFKANDGTGCLLNIYEEGYTGSSADTTKTGADVPFTVETGIKALTPAANPFEYNEIDDDNLLNVLRYKTGYIRVEEETYGELEDLYPATEMQHYLEFYYGSELNFTGFMQAQAFDNSWIASPRLMQFPIISPLGLVKNMKFAKPIASLPNIVTSDSIFQEIINGLNAAYSKIVTPTEVVSFSINRMLICPFNDYPVEQNGSDAYDPLTYFDFLETYCNLWGLIMHDTPTAIVFSKYDYDGEYNNTTTTGDTTENIDDYFSIASDDHRESLVAPLKNITVNYDGEVLERSNSLFERFVYVRADVYLSGAAAWFKNVTPEFSGLLDTNSLVFPGNKPSSVGATLALVSDGTQILGAMSDAVKGILVYRSTWSPVQYQLFVCRFFTFPRPSSVYDALKITVDNIKCQYINQIDTATDRAPISISVSINDQFYHYSQTTGASWGSGEALFSLSSNSSLIIFGDANGIPEGACMIIRVYVPSSHNLSDGDLIFIKNITVENFPVAVAEYTEDAKNTRTISGNSEGAQKEGSIRLLFSFDKKNSNTIYNADAYYTYTAPTFSYMFLSENRLQIFVRTTLFPSDIYLKKWAYWITGWRWRIIAISFTPITNTYKITMHRSSTIET